MRNLFFKTCLGILAFHASMVCGFASDLPKCEGSPRSVTIWTEYNGNCHGTPNSNRPCPKWDNCFGRVTIAGGTTYVGEFQNGRFHCGKWWNSPNSEKKGYPPKLIKKCQDKSYKVRIPVAKKLMDNNPTILNTLFNKLSVDQRKQIQLTLQELGFYNSTIDGLYGNKTKTALVTYSKKYFGNYDLKNIKNTNSLLGALLYSVPRKQNCDTDPRLCTIAQLCNKASKQNISGKKVWKTTGEATKYVAEAQRNGVSCGVQSVVAQPAPKPKDNKTYKVSSGSGFYVSEAGHIITNHHVIDGCKTMKIQKAGEVWDTTFVANDPQNDIALLKANKKPAHVFALSTETPFPLQDIIVAGFPFGDRYSSALKFTQGIISALIGVDNNYSQIQIDAALQPGNSGGPIMDEYGNIVGVAVAKLSLKKIVDEYGVVPENTNFGVKTSAVKNLMEGNRIPFKKPNSEVIQKSKLSQIATDGTVHLTCWMTTAQIEAIKKRTDNRKVLFSQFESE